MNVCHGISRFLDLKLAPLFLSFLDSFGLQKNLEVDNFFVMAIFFLSLNDSAFISSHQGYSLSGDQALLLFYHYYSIFGEKSS